MDDMIRDMIDKGLATIIPVWFAALYRYEPNWVYWMEWKKLNSN